MGSHHLSSCCGRGHSFTSPVTDPSLFQHSQRAGREPQPCGRRDARAPWQGWSPADPTTRPLPAQSTPRGVGEEGRGVWRQGWGCGAQSITAGAAAGAAEHWRLQSLNKLEIRLNFLPQFHKLRFLHLLSRPGMLSAQGQLWHRGMPLSLSNQPASLEVPSGSSSAASQATQASSQGV